MKKMIRKITAMGLAACICWTTIAGGTVYAAEQDPQTLQSISDVNDADKQDTGITDTTPSLQPSTEIADPATGSETETGEPAREEDALLAELPKPADFKTEFLLSEDGLRMIYRITPMNTWNTEIYEIDRVRVRVSGSTSEQSLLYECGYTEDQVYEVSFTKEDLSVLSGEGKLQGMIYTRNCTTDASEQIERPVTAARIITQEEQDTEKQQSDYEQQEAQKVVLQEELLDQTWMTGTQADVTETPLPKEDQEAASVETEKVELFSAREAAGVTANLAADQKTATLSTAAMTNISNIKELRFAVWSATGGQDDLHWYQGTCTASKYQQKITISDYKHAGLYYAHAYMTAADGSVTYYAGTSFTVNAPSVSNLTVSDVNESSGIFSIDFSVAGTKSGIAQARVAVWCSDNQDDMFWYTASPNAGAYQVSANITNHKLHTGTYRIHVYVTDGNGFVSYAGGTSKKIAEVKDKLYIRDVNQNQTVFQALLSGSSAAGSTQVRFAVWSDAGGQDDLRWYTAISQNGVWTQNIAVADHKSVGKYQVHAYAFSASGAATYLKGSSFLVDAPKNTGIEFSETDSGFSTLVKGITVPSGVSKVELGVWCQDDQSDMKWYQATKSGTDYSAAISLANHKSHIGTYKVHVYVTDGNGIKSFCDAKTIKVGFSCDKLIVDGDEHTKDHTVTITGLKTYGLASAVQVAVWTQENGQDDLKWYQAVKTQAGYQIHLSTDDFKHGGAYDVHAYAVKNDGEKVYLSGTAFTINGITSVSDPANGKFRVSVEKLASESKLTSVTALVTAGSSSHEYTATKESSGSYTTEIKLEDLGYVFGDYKIQFYAITAAGKTAAVSTTKYINITAGTIQATADTSSKMKYHVTLGGINLLGIASNIRFGVWSAEGGQDDFRWYSAVSDNQTYTCVIPLGNHKSSGDYYVHAYFDLPNGTSRFINSTTFRVTSLPGGETIVAGADGNAGTMTVETQVGSANIGSNSLRAAVWSSANQSDMVWYPMSKRSDGIYTAIADVKNHGVHFGNYYIHVYAGSTYVAGTQYVLQADNYLWEEEVSSDVQRFTVYGPNVNGQKVSRVVFPTWTEKNGQDDIRWNEGTLTSDGGYSVTINRNSYANSGIYYTHIYYYIGDQAYMEKACTYSLYRSGEFDEYAQEVMRKIIYAVETGGQIYGNARYDAFTQAYTNSTKETAITLGAGQWFATEAKRLLTLIRSKDPNSFAVLDTAGIGTDIDTANWTTYGGDGAGHATILKGSAKALCLQKIISSTAGKAIQDQLVDDQMITYVSEAEALGVTDLKGKMFLANVRHLGGYSTMKWVVECCQEDQKKLTMENLYQSMRDHTTNKAGNGVGADKYDSRHQKVMTWLNQYLD